MHRLPALFLLYPSSTCPRTTSLPCQPSVCPVILQTFQRSVCPTTNRCLSSICLALRPTVPCRVSMFRKRRHQPEIPDLKLVLFPTPASVKNNNTKKSPRLPWLNRNDTGYSRAGVPSASCANCCLPIAGRVVTASGSSSGNSSTSSSSSKARFHPECFTCHHCSTSLESVDFYPEPEAKRAERLARDYADPSCAPD